jgi:hypothetical protein
MADDPKTIREVNFAFAGLEGRVGLLIKIGIAVLGFLGAVLGVVATIYVQIGDVKVDVASIKATVESLSNRLGTIEGDVKATRSDQRQILTQLPPPSPPPVPHLQELIAGGFYVTDDEAKLIRAFLKVPPKNPNLSGTWSIWSRIDPVSTQPLPEDIIAKIGKFKGLRFAVDANNAIALVEPTQDVVIAII